MVQYVQSRGSAHVRQRAAGEEPSEVMGEVLGVLKRAFVVDLRHAFSFFFLHIFIFACLLDFHMILLLVARCFMIFMFFLVASSAWCPRCVSRRGRHAT